MCVLAHTALCALMYAEEGLDQKNSVAYLWNHHLFVSIFTCVPCAGARSLASYFRNFTDSQLSFFYFDGRV